MGKYKLPLSTGFSALMGHIKQIKKTADQAGSAVSDLATATAEGLGEVEKILDEKQDRGTGEKITIPASGWVSGQGGQYPYRYDIPAVGATVNDRADISIAPESVGTAVDCGLCPTTETITGAIRLRSAVKPTADMAAEYWLHQGKE